MAMVVWVGAGMEVVDGIHAGQSQGGWSHVGRCWSVSRVRGDDTLITSPFRCAARVGLSRYWSVLLERT